MHSRSHTLIGFRWRHPVFVVVAAYIAARGVTVRGAAAYLSSWLLVAAASRFSISALGLQFAPPGSASLDTVAVVVLLLPASILAGVLESQAPTLEATRSRSRYPAQVFWIITVVAVTVITPVAAAPLLHASIDKVALLNTWCMAIGVWFVAAFFGSALFAAACTFALLALFSTPALVPWEANVIYNVDMKTSASVVAIGALAVGAILQALRYDP
jgi:hypothetical protein